MDRILVLADYKTRDIAGAIAQRSKLVANTDLSGVTSTPHVDVARLDMGGASYIPTKKDLSDATIIIYTFEPSLYLLGMLYYVLENSRTRFFDASSLVTMLQTIDEKLQ